MNLSSDLHPEAACFVTQFNDLTCGGLGRYENSLYPHLKAKAGAQLATMEAWPVPGALAGAARLAGRDLRALARNFPSRIPGACRAGVVHLSHQTLALSLLFGKPRRAVVTVHDIIPYVEAKTNNGGSSEMTGFWEGRLYAAALKGLRRADAIIADSTQTKRDLIRFLHIPESRIQVVPLGVDRQIFKPTHIPDSFYRRMGLEPSKQYLLYVGSQEARKNLPLLFRALCEIQPRKPDVRLLIAGTPRSSFSHAQFSLLRELGIPELVHFLGFVSEPDLASLYNLSRALVMPSLYEGFGLPLLEAMACGCPVISSNAASLPEVAGPAALLLDPCDVSAWVQAVLDVLDDEALRRSLAGAGFVRVHSFSWEATAEATVAIYRRVSQ